MSSSAAPAVWRWRPVFRWCRRRVPVAYKAEVEKGGAFLDLLRQQNELNWMFLSPSALSTAGERTGKFRLGNAQLLAAADGKS
jgi:uncharacterized protein